jgi:predicted Rossmann-fold nucleotide-binding protein
MERLADAALGAGGRVVCVIPDGLFGREIAHTELTELHEVRTMHEGFAAHV